jgi:hydroxymethylglutaryl-CoA lyase
MVKIIETPRDAFQGIKTFIPTHFKLEYINALLKVGFDTVEVGSFVSPKAIPQMRDTAEIIKGLDLAGTSSRIMVLVANIKGLESAVEFDQINDIAYPFSASPTFLKKNINKSQIESLLEIEDCLNICEKKNKRLIVYITMAFGNPYGDEWNMEMMIKWTETLKQLGVQCIPYSDITGEADEKKIQDIFSSLIPLFPEIEFGLHLHSEKDTAFQKVEAALKAGCRRFDSVLGGFGGCPMTGKEMLANLNSETLIDYLSTQKIISSINREQLDQAKDLKIIPN